MANANPYRNITKLHVKRLTLTRDLDSRASPGTPYIR